MNSPSAQGVHRAGGLDRFRGHTLGTSTLPPLREEWNTDREPS